MSRNEFLRSLAEPAPPAGLTLAQEALWHAKKGDWSRAHERAQEQHDRMGSRVHAYLHRWEGDDGNAAYWYRQAGQPFCKLTLDEEWEQLAQALFSE